MGSGWHTTASTMPHKSDNHSYDLIFRRWRKPCWCSVAVYLTLCDPVDCSTPGFSVLYRFLEFAQTHVHCVNDAIQPSHLLSLPSPPALSFSQHQGLSQWVSYLHQSGLISFRIDWFDLLEVQRTLKSLLQCHNSRVWILWLSAFFMVQLSLPYMTTGKTNALTI